MPGGLAFGHDKLHLHTLLGSCVSVVVWHPRLLLGGMCHYVLPRREINQLGRLPDGRYGSDALGLLHEQMARSVMKLTEYTVHVFGGARCFSQGQQAHYCSPEIGEENIAAAERWCNHHGLVIRHREVGGDVYRRLSFDIASGKIDVRSGACNDWPPQAPKHTSYGPF